MNGPIQAHIRAEGPAGFAVSWVATPVDHDVLVTEDDLDGQTKTGGEANEAAERHGIDQAHHPGVLIGENPELALQIRLDFTRNELHQHYGREQDARNDRPLNPVRCAKANRIGKDDVEADRRRKEANQKHAGNPTERAQRAADIRRHRLSADIVHAEPAGKGERNQEQQPEVARIVDKGFAPCGILPIRVPEPFSRIMGAPPKTPMVMNSGTRICMVVTPALPSPALSPSASPRLFLGKKKLMFDMDEAKLPPPIPERNASIWKTQSGVSFALQGQARSDGRNHEQGRGKEDGITTTRNADEETAGNSQRGAGQAGDGGQCEQLSLGNQGSPG